MKFFSALIFFVLALASCAKEETVATHLAVEDIQRLPVNTKASEIIDTFAFVPLGTLPDSGFLNYLTKVAFDEGIYFIREGQSRQGLFLFSENGSYLRQVRPATEGANPFASIDDFSLDEANNRIYLLSNRSRRIGVLDYQLRLLDTIALSIAADAIAFVEDRLILTSPNEPEVIAILDLEGRVLHRLFPDGLSGRLKHFMPLDRNNNFVLYHHWQENNIYKITPDGSTELYFSLSFNQEMPPGRSPIASVNKVGKHLILSAKGKQIPMSMIVSNLESGKTIRFNTINNDISLNKNLVLPVIGKRDDQLITYMPSEYLLQQAEQVKQHEINEPLGQVLRQLDIASNPVLVLMGLH